LRGKLYLKDKIYEKALSDFKTATEIDPKRAPAYVGQGDCLRFLGAFDEAVNCFTEAINREPAIINSALLKRAITYIELKHNEEALADLDTLIVNDPINSEAHYFRGTLLEKKRDHNEAILCFEQAIKHNTSKKAVIKSLYEITRIKIETRSFYEAYHTLNRADLLSVDQKMFSKFRIFTDGVIYLMKRKYDEGIENLSTIIKKNPSDFLKPMAFCYRAYGNFCAGKIKKSLQDYTELQKFMKLDRAASYNKILCEAILAAEEDNFDLAFSNFDKALKLYKNKMEPHFYRCVLSIYQYRKLHSLKEKKKFNFCLSSSIKDLDRAIELNDNNANAFYIRALILYILGRFEQANITIEKAIEKADENYPKYYFLRAAISAASGQYQKAINDCTITINLDKDYSAAYLERGKCYYSTGDIKQAFLDI
jgi:tetratricopeptide (TPR) repeat protein